MTYSVYRVECSCGHKYISVIPTLHLAELECPECRQQAVPEKKDLVTEE